MSKNIAKTITALLLLALGGTPAQAVDFSSLPQCNDGVDNDGDGRTDYSTSVGGGDPGCDAWNDNSEADGGSSGKIKPRLAILFDTSGSMMWGICGSGTDGDYGGGDGTRECTGSNISCGTCQSATCNNMSADDTRIYKTKKGLYDAVAAYGELDWSLYRFHQERQGSFVACPGTWSGSGSSVGRWKGAASDASNCNNGGVNYARADRLVKFASENQRAILDWFDNTSNWSPATGGEDYELRPSGFTPIAGSLATIRDQLNAIRAQDPQVVRDCRPYRVVVVSDGADTCNGQEAAENAAEDLERDNIEVYVVGFAANASLKTQMDAIAAAGGTGSAFFADEPSQLSDALAQIADELILVEKCNGEDDDCDGVVDNGFNTCPENGPTCCNNGELGACFHEGHIKCVTDSETACDAPPGDPSPEVCNGIDDDCDGVIDDGLNCAGCGTEICNGRDDDCDGDTDEGDLPGEGAECGIDEGICAPGHYQCVGGRLQCTGQTGPQTETCNGLDDNCDGVIDHLVRSCYGFPTGCVDKDPRPGSTNYECKGRCRAGTQTCTIMTQPNYSSCEGDVGPATEICDGQDNDCDGQVDEGFENVGQPCEVGTGLCKTTGLFVCSGGGVVCNAPIVTGTPEVCNGVDDDCNNVIDDLPNPPPSPIGEPCGTCGGVYQCRGGLVCAGGSANAETCNGLDDDCNNIVDDGTLPGVGDPCVPTTNGVPDFVVRGECKAGNKQCIAAGLVCVGFVGPQNEVCDGKDNDCDGNVDDMAACPSPTDACYNAQCVSRCLEGEFPCPFGQFCKTLPEGRYCVPDPCVGRTCPEGQVCDSDTTECKDPCEGVTCPSGTQCRGGRCLDCFSLGCPTGQTCVENDNRIGECKTDQCMNVTCGDRQTCDTDTGACVAVECAAGCAAGQKCEKGACVARCGTDVCFGANCAEGFVCNPASGRCIADPCDRTNCGGTVCALTCEGEATCSLSEGIDVLATGNGGYKLGCEIGVATSSRAPWLAGLLYLGLVVGLRFRRRRK